MEPDKPLALLDPSRRPLCEKWIKRLHHLAGRLDQIEACGEDCLQVRALADYLSKEFAKVRDHICDNKPVLKG